MILPSTIVRDLVLSQYSDSENLLALLDIYCEELDELMKATHDVIDLRYIDKAFGIQLDHIGKLVGASRTLSGVTVSGYFGYLDRAESLGMGKDDDNSVGGLFRSERDETLQDLVLPDQQYLNWIKAKILLNNTEGGKEDCIAFFKLLLNDPSLPVHLSVPNRATISISLGKQLSLIDVSVCIAYAKAVKPIGVTMHLFDTVGEILLHDIDLIGEYFD